MASTLGEGEKKFLEGWTSHRSESLNAWKRCWMVLRGTFIFLFCSNKQSKENMVASLILGHGTSVSDIKSKKEFKFELSTISREGQKKKDIFKFNKENECCLWKSYIVAIATGSMPTEARRLLTPGQQSDIYEAMVEVRRRNGASASAASGHPAAAAAAPPPHPANGRPLHLYRASRRSEIDEDEDEDFVMNDPALKQLSKRLEELAKKEIDDSQLTPSVTSWPNIEIVDTIGSKKSQPFSPYSLLPVASPIQATPAATSANNRSTNQSKRTSFSNHVFYSDGLTRRNDIPSWFVNCSRVQAETVLTTAKRFGSVLMRPSSQFPINGNCVISFRRELNGKVVVSHYNTIRTDEGYKIDVENTHPAMESLSVVMEFFLSVAGKSAKALTSNDLTELLGRYQAAAFPSVTEEEVVERRSNASSSVLSRGLDPSSGSQPNMSGSNRSSGSVGSLSSRNSRGSFDLVNRRPSDLHAQPLPSSYYTADDDDDNGRLSAAAAASGVFYDGHRLAKAGGSDPGGGDDELSPPPPPPAYGGSSFAGSTVYSDLGDSGSPKTDLLLRRSVNSVSSPNDDGGEIYSNQSETVNIIPDNPGSVVASGSSYGPATSEYGSETYNSNNNNNNNNNVRDEEFKSRSGGSIVSGVSGNGRQDQSGRIFGKHQINSPPNAAAGVYLGSAGPQYSQNSTPSPGVYAKQNSSKLGPPPTPPKPGAREIYALMKPTPFTTTDAGDEYSSVPEIDETTLEQ